jgi:hypothetical protein
MRNNDSLRDPKMYTVPGVEVVGVEVEYANTPVYDPPTILGGAPAAVYLLLDANPYSPSPIVAGYVSLTDIVDFDGVGLSGSPTASVVTKPEKPIDYWTSPGLRTSETFMEFRKLGRSQFSPSQPLNYSTAQFIGKLNDLMSGGLFSYLGTSLPGYDPPAPPSGFSPAGFSDPAATIPGVGSTYSFQDGVVPFHVDKLWGPSDGRNRLFRATIAFHAHACVVLVAEGATESVDAGVLEASRWYAPTEGLNRQIVMLTPPPVGATVLAVYLPRQSLIQVGREIIAYDSLNPYTGEFVIYGRAQLCTELTEHNPGDVARDVWAASFVQRAEYNQLAFGASGRPLEYIAMDSGCPRGDQPTLSDTELRRVIFHTSRGMLGTPATAREAIRYLYPRLWPYILVGEDPRWPKCIVLWYDGSKVIGEEELDDPPIEPWETWLDDVSWPDGFRGDILTETYYRDDAVDDAWYGDYWLASVQDDPELWPYPVILSGVPTDLIGPMAPEIPPPFLHDGIVDYTYKNYMSRPVALDKALPAGCGVLLLDYSKLT